MPPLPSTARQISSLSPLVQPHSEGHEENGGDPVLMPIRYLGTASTTSVYSDNTGNFGDVTSLTLTLQTRGGDLLIFFRGRVDVTDTLSHAGYQIRADVDGTALRVNTHEITHAAVASGIITLWSGSTASIPAGWLICDGTNSTPDLRDRFIVGAGSTYAVAATGGSTVQSDHNEHDTHATHGTHSNQGFLTGVGANALDLTADSGAHSAHSAHAAHGSHGTNLPPYYALAYIMSTGSSGTDTITYTNSSTNVWLTTQLPGVHTVKIQAKSIGASTAFTIDENSDMIVFELLPVRRG